MRKLLLLLICIPFLGNAQTDYELEFNSTTLDYVEMAGASSLIANTTSFSMSGWVNPQINTTHSGIMGFRNNLDADFYLLLLQNSNNVEARFRNSAGVKFDVLATNLLDLNQWQHLAFTYDGTYIRLYKNGNLVDSTGANGTITQTTQSFKIGTLDWSGTGFYMNGSLDEVRLWEATLSQNAINNWMCSEITFAHPYYNSLAGYWRLNDGVGTMATDLSVNANNGTLNNNPIWQVSTSCFGSPLLTYVPDDNFENYLEANGMGDGIALNDSVFTSAIDTATILSVSNQFISDLTGIEDMVSLEILYCNYNQLSSLDISNNLNLVTIHCHGNLITTLDISGLQLITVLDCGYNQITSLDISNLSGLKFFSCLDNQLTSLDVSNNDSLIDLNCGSNLINSLSLTNNTILFSLECYNNALTSLDVRNGNNQYINEFKTAFNPQLYCIDVDDAIWSTSICTSGWGNIDAQHYFSQNCSVSVIKETENTKKELMKITDILGRIAKGKKNELLFYIYNDGRVEKRFNVAIY